MHRLAVIVQTIFRGWRQRTRVCVVKYGKSWTELETGGSISHPAVLPSVFSQSEEIYNLKLSAGKAFDDQEKLELFLILDPNWAGNPKLVVNEVNQGD